MDYVLIYSDLFPQQNMKSNSTKKVVTDELN